MQLRNCFLFFSVFCLASKTWGDDLQTLSGPKQLQPSIQSTEDLPAPLENGDESILISELKGLVLVGSQSLVERTTSGGDGIIIKGLEVPGGEEKLIDKLASFLGKPVSQKTINRIKRQIVLYYRSEHHPVMMVIVPEQVVLSGVLQLLVIESRVGKVTVKNARSAATTYRILDKIRLNPGDNIDDRKLLQDISWINQNPFQSANAVFSPGDEFGTTNIDIQMRERRPWRLYAGADNTGSKYTGETRWFVGFNVENGFFPGNIFSYQFTGATNIHKFQSQTVQSVAPLPWRQTLSLFGGYATVHPDLPGFKSKGKSYQASARYEMPLWFTYPNWQQQFTLGFDFKGTNNSLVFGQDNIPVQSSIANVTQFVFGYHTAWDNRHKIATGGDLFWSPGSMVAHQGKHSYESLNPNATPKYVYGRISYSQQGPIYRGWDYFGMGRLQLANNSLLASEQFGLGGYNTVRGYRERVVNGDNAYCLNFEIRTPSFKIFPRKWQDKMYFLGFFDCGHAWDHKKIPGFPLSQTLIGIGAGFRYIIGPYLTSRFDVGFPQHKVQGSKEKVRGHVSVVLSY